MRHGRRSAALALAAFLSLGAAPARAQSHNIDTVAGTGNSGSVGDGGPATQADVPVPVGVTSLPDGGYLIAQQGLSLVRRVAADGTITTIAGNGSTNFTGDGGPATSAALNIPSGAVPLPGGGYLIADTGNHRIRRIAADGTITTVVGNGSATFGGDNAQAVDAQVNFPFDVALEPDGGYLIADADNDRIRRVAPDGI